VEGVGEEGLLDRTQSARPVVSPIQDCAIGSIPSTSPLLHDITPVLNMSMTGSNYIRHIGMTLSGFMIHTDAVSFQTLTARRFILARHERLPRFLLPRYQT